MSQLHVEQVGGDHYQAEYQHWDLVGDYGVHYFEATATKYVDRWRRKGGVQDLRKAISYLEKRLKLIERKPDTDEFGGCAVGQVWRGFAVSYNGMLRWFDAVKMDSTERRICGLILFWEKPDHLRESIKLIESLVQTEATSAYVDQ